MLHFFLSLSSPSPLPLFNQKWIGWNIDRSPEDTEDELKKAIEVLGKSIKSLETGRDLFAPEWWSEWLALNRPKSENTNQSGDGNVAASGTRLLKGSDKV